MGASQRSRKEAAFLESILAGPLEDANRLVYADWLEEQGDPRAEFVRLAVKLGELDAGDARHGPAEARCGELQRPLDPWWAERVRAPSRLRRLLRLTESRFGPLAELYTKKLYNSRCLHPPATRKAVQASERRLKFPLPPLLGMVYTCLGNGGLLLSLIGLRGGQTGFDDVGFKNRNIVTGYEGCQVSVLPKTSFPLPPAYWALMGCGPNVLYWSTWARLKWKVALAWPLERRAGHPCGGPPSERLSGGPRQASLREATSPYPPVAPCDAAATPRARAAAMATSRPTAA